MTNKPASGSPEPFRRPVTWGRPPQTVFRAGPLPKGERLPPLPEPPRVEPTRAPISRPVGATGGGSIFGGSMIPQAAPRSRPAPVVEAAARPEPTSEVRQSVEAPARQGAPAPDLTVRPLPDAPPRLTAPATTPVASEAPARPAAPLTSRPVREAEPSPAVSSTLIAATARRKPSGRMPLYLGAAAAVVAAAGLGVWFMGRGADTPTAVSPPGSAEAVPAATATSPSSTTEIASALTAPAPVEIPAAALSPEVRPATTPRVAAPRPSTPAPAATRPAPAPVQPAPATPTQTPPPPAPVIVTQPLIETAPPQPAGPPPTAAQPPASDPDGPVVTQPQPLD